MKKLLVLITVASIGFACDNPVSKKIKETKESVTTTTKAVQEMSNMQEDIQELQQQEPLTNDELKAWLPEEINGMKRTAYKAGQMGMAQIASIEATYGNEDKSKTFKIEVIDGAGQMGAAMTAAMRMAFASQDFEEEDEYKTRRTVKKKGVKAIEEYHKNNNRSVIEFFKEDRFYMKATGTNMDIEATWEAIDELDANDLG
ncbi:hypothetical protein [Altibacter lentus]|uniref:hypothetical protein n=1 Tax=Altibacter lentus TaxID=1223410 RepID=UPI0005531CC7|nr:hypothetical protein [Altibacter lentus]